MLKNTILILSLVLACSVAEAREKYKILGKPVMGSNYRAVEVELPIPFNKEYHQFTPEQRSIYRSMFDGLKKEDIPPYPKQGLRRLYDPLIKGHVRIARSGWLRLIANIDEKGKVAEVRIYESPHAEIAELATSVMFNAKFAPATCAGKPCAMDFQFEYEMQPRVKQFNTLHGEDLPGMSSQPGI